MNTTGLKVNTERTISLAGLAENDALDTFSPVNHESDPVTSTFGLHSGVGDVEPLEREGASYYATWARHAKCEGT